MSVGEGMLWSGWGDPARRAPLPAAVRQLLAAALGLPAEDTLPVDLADVRVRPSALAEGTLAALAATVGAGAVHTDRASRIRHAAGRSTVDLLRLRRGDAEAAPDAVVVPADHEATVALLAVCAAHDVAVVPFGGGTSVVGGVAPGRGGHHAVVAVDTRAMVGLHALDTVDRLAVFGAGATGPQAEALLRPQGLQLGHLPQSFEHATLGGYAATRYAGQASSGHGRFAEMVEALTVATPEGTLRLGRGPASAAGPDLRQLLLGSEGRLGVITDLTLRVRPLPSTVVEEGWRFPDLAGGVAAMRALAQGDGTLPTVLRLSDEAETAVGLATSPGEGGGEPGCLAVAAWEGDEDGVARRRAAALPLLRGAGGECLGPVPAQAWRAGRFHAPHLRDGILDAGALVDTLETATRWSGLLDLHTRLRIAIEGALAEQGTPGIVLAHVSHVYPSGASLYVTVVARQAEDPVAQWEAVAAAAADARTAAGATITHHHAVGLAHRPWMEAEVGPLGVRLLRAAAATLDPAGILNPGKLIPPEG